MVASGMRTVAGLCVLAFGVSGCGSPGGSGGASAPAVSSASTVVGATRAAVAVTPPAGAPAGSGPRTGYPVAGSGTSPSRSGTATPATVLASLDLDVEVPGWTQGSVSFAADVPLGGKPAWAPDGVALTRDAQGRWVGKVAVAPGAVVHGKLTRGGWDTVEKGPALEGFADRTLTAGQGPTPAYLHVYHWGDDQIPNVTGNLRDLGDFTPRSLGTPHKIVAHLPPGYDDVANAGRRYPVLYALDGQNLYDPARSFLGVVWGLDKAADNNATPFIAIGIDNTAARVDEYCPSYDASVGGGGRLEDTASFIFDELKPAIDALYRTSPSADDTGIMGSSLGGLAALHMGLKHADKVHRVASVSPSLWWNNSETLAFVQGLPSKPPLTKLWLDIGTNEGSNPQQTVDDTRAVRDALVAKGFTLGQDLGYKEAQGARHDEGAWAARLPDILGFCFP